MLRPMGARSTDTQFSPAVLHIQFIIAYLPGFFYIFFNIRLYFYSRNKFTELSPA